MTIELMGFAAHSLAVGQTGQLLRLIKVLVRSPATIKTLLVAAIGLSAVAATAAPSSSAASASKPSWGLAAGGGLVGGLGLANNRTSFGVEGSLWLGKLAPTRAIGLDVAWTTKAYYAELQAATSLWHAHDGALHFGLAAGPLFDRANGGRWGGQATTWIAFTPVFIFPYARIPRRGEDDALLGVRSHRLFLAASPGYKPLKSLRDRYRSGTNGRLTSRWTGAN